MNSALMVFIWLLVVLETTVFPVPLTVTMVSIVSMLWGFQSIVFLFFLGLLYDAFTLRPFGLSSIFFLIVCVLASRYQRKLYVGKVVYALIFIGSITAAHEWIFLRSVKLNDVLLSVFIGGVVLLLINRFSSSLGSVQS